MKMQWTLEKRRQVHTFHDLTQSGKKSLASPWRKTTVRGSRRTPHGVGRQVVWEKQDWTYQGLANELFMSASEVLAGIKRAIAARLMDQYRMALQKKAFEEFRIRISVR
jgi:hypothetical protein